MTKSMTLLTGAVLLSLATPAFAADTTSASSETKVERDANGNYDRKTTSESTDATGTTNENETDVKVKRDGNGNYKKSVVNKSSADPQGLLNKTTAKSTTTEEKNADGTASYHYKKQINGKTVEDNETKTN